MHDAARGLNNDLPQRVDGLIDSRCSEEEFLRQLTELCAGARDTAWTVLARIDQNYRRGKLSPERFRLARVSIERRMLGVTDAHAASIATRTREPSAPPPPIIEALAVIEALPAAAAAPAPPTPEPARRTDKPRAGRIAVVALIVAALAAALIAQTQHASQRGRAPAAAAVAAAPLIAVAETPVPVAASPPAHIGFDSDRTVVQPGEAVAEVTVVRSGDSGAEVRIPWWTESAGARAGEDFVARGRQTLILAAGEERASLQVRILRNAHRRHIQMFYVRLGPPDGAELNAPSRATVFIVPR